MPRSASRPLLLGALVLGLFVALTAPSSSSSAKGPETLPLPDGFQPEGIASDPRGRGLFVGSIPTGRIVRIDPKTGRSSIVVPQREGRSAIGLKADRGLLFVAGGQTGRAFVYDARTGADVANVALTPPPTFVNDVTLTRRAAFFTDSQRPQIYRLARDAKGRPAGGATTLPITGDLRYDEDPQTFEANGIAATPSGSTLYVVQSRTGGIFRVDPDTGASTAVPLSGLATSLPNGDGILLKGRTLYVVQNRLNRIAVVRLSGDGRSGRVESFLTDDDFDVPTTVARENGSLFAVNARFGTPPTPTTDYDVVRVDDERGRGDEKDRSDKDRGGKGGKGKGRGGRD